MLLRWRLWVFLKEFFESSCFVRSISATFVVLIPKKGGA